MVSRLTLSASDILSIFLVSVRVEGLLKTDASELSPSLTSLSPPGPLAGPLLCSALSYDPSSHLPFQADRFMIDTDATDVGH